jgi:segregation and condensation protein A
MHGGTADPGDGLAVMAARDASPAAPAADGPEAGPPGTPAGEGGTPLLTLDGFNGPLERLLVLARARQVDLARLSLAELIAQLASALQHASPATPLGQKGDWVVMAAWLLQLRSLLLLPAHAPARQEAAVEADQLRARLLSLQAMRTLAGWLEQRPQFGRDVFARGRPELFGVALAGAPPPDVIAFLWASLALFDDDAGSSDTASVYRPPSRLELYDVAEARERILRRLAEMPDGGRFEQFLPDAPEPAGDEPRRALRWRSAWSSTFVASLELARQGNVALAQEGAWTTIEVTAPDGVTASVVS